MEKRESVFMQMHNGTRAGEGSFNQGLKNLFYLADMENRRKLVKAFPKFFGDEVSEFGIYKDVPQPDKKTKNFRHKGWLCQWSDEIQSYVLYTPDELEQPAGFREAEFECNTIDACKAFINSY